MALIDANGRMINKRTDVANREPQIAPSNDHTDGSWDSQDIYIGELYMNTNDDRVFTRTNNGIIEFLMSTSGGTTSFGTGTTLDLCPNGVLNTPAISGCSPVDMQSELKLDSQIPITSNNGGGQINLDWGGVQDTAALKAPDASLGYPIGFNADGQNNIVQMGVISLLDTIMSAEIKASPIRFFTRGVNSPTTVLGETSTVDFGINSVAIETRNATISDTRLEGSLILGGRDNSILGPTGTTIDKNSQILGGKSNTITSGTTNATIIGGQNITADTSDTVYTPNLNIDTKPTEDTSVTEMLMRDSNGNVKQREVSGLTSDLDAAGNDEEIQFNSSGNFDSNSFYRLHYNNGGAATLAFNRNGSIGNGSFVINGGHINYGSSEASGANSFAGGEGNVASGLDSVALGLGNTSSGEGSFTIGEGNEASGNGSVAFGNSNIASGEASHAEGKNTTASSEASHVEGNSNTASGEASHAEGGIDGFGNVKSTKASGNSSHSEGFDTEASGFGSHAEGNGSIAAGSPAHAEGYFTKATGFVSHAGGASYGSNDKLLASGIGAFVHTLINNDGGPSGATADWSAILGGQDNHIESNATNAVIVGGNNITADTADTVFTQNIDVKDKVSKAIKSVSSNYTTSDDHTILADASGGAITITLPDPSNEIEGLMYIIKKTDASNDVTIDTNGGNIDGSTSQTLTAQYERIKVQSDGTDWWIID